MHLYVEASPRRYGAEPAGPKLQPLQPGHASAKKPRGKAVRGGRDPQTSVFQVRPRSMKVMIVS